MPGRGKLLLELLNNKQPSPPKPGPPGAVGPGAACVQGPPQPGHQHNTTPAPGAAAAGVNGVMAASGVPGGGSAAGGSGSAGASSSGSDRDNAAPQPSKPSLTEAIDAVNARQHKNDEALACLEDWNPMEDDFKCPDFNSYDNGPGKDLPLHIQRPVEGQKPAREGRMNELYVTGIPLAMSEEGLQNLFARAGKVVRVKKLQSKFLDRPDTYGFVQLSDTAGVENAVRMIDNLEVGGCVMHVRIALGAAEREARRKRKEQPIQYKLADEHEDNEDDNDDLVIGDGDMVEEDDTTSAEPATVSDDVTATPPATLPPGSSSLGAIPQVTTAPPPGGTTVQAPPTGGTTIQAPPPAVAPPTGSGQGTQETSDAPRPKEAAPVGARLQRPPPPSAKQVAPVKPPEKKRVRKKLEPRPCMLCGLMASQQCGRCQGPYCGVKCQQEDWLKHKYMCQKPANKFEERFMIDDDEVANSMDDVVDQIRIDESALRRETLPLGVPTQVLLTDMRSPSDFSLVKSHNLPALEELKTSMNRKFSVRAREADYHPQRGDVCAAPYQGDWYRALIDHIDPARTVAVLTFIDYGNVDTVALSDLAKLPPAMVGMAAQAIPCSLGVAPAAGSWCEQSLQLLVDLVYTEGVVMATVLVARKDKNIVDITKGVDGVNIADRLVSEGVARRITGSGPAVETPPQTVVTPATLVTQSTSAHLGDGDAETAKPLSAKPASTQPSQTTPTQSETAPHTTPTPHQSTAAAPQSVTLPQTPPASQQKTPTAEQPQPPLTTQPKTPSPNKPSIVYSPSKPHSGDGDSVPRVAMSRGGGSTVQSYIKKREVRTGDQLPVVVVHVGHVDSFWVQAGEQDHAFTKMNQQLQAVYTAKTPKTGFRCPGHHLVAAFSPVYQEWYRGHVRGYNTATVHVFLVDLGQEEWVAFHHVHSLDSAFCSVPAQAMGCRLESSIPRTEATLAGFHSYVDAALLQCKVLGEVGGCYVVDLHDTRKPTSLRDALLNQTGLSPGTHTPKLQPRNVAPPLSPSPAPSTPPSAAAQTPFVAASPPGVTPSPGTVVMASSLPLCSLPPSTTTEHKVIVTNPTAHNNIVVIDVNNSESFDTFLDQICVELEQYAGSYRPQSVGELVYVREASCGWSRGEVLGIGPSDSARVKLLDTNKLSRVGFGDLAAVRAAVRQPAVQAVRCVLHGVAGLAPGVTWERDVMPRLDGSRVMRAVVRVHGDPCSVELYHQGEVESLNTVLARDGLVLLTEPTQTGTSTPGGLPHQPPHSLLTGHMQPMQPTLNKPMQPMQPTLNKPMQPTLNKPMQPIQPTLSRPMQPTHTVPPPETAHSTQPPHSPQGAVIKPKGSPSVNASSVTNTSHFSKPSLPASKTSPQPQSQKSATTSDINPGLLSGGVAATRELSLGLLTGGGQPQQFRTQRPTVTVCHVEDPGSFYCHWNEPAVRKTFEEEERSFREDMVSGSRHHGAPALASLTAGRVIAALSPANNTWYRAQVLETNFHDTQKVLVRLVDYGCKDLVPGTFVRSLPEAHGRLPHQAIHCAFPMWDPVQSPNVNAAIEITKMTLENNDFDLSLDGFEDGKYRVIDMREPGAETSLIRQSGPMQLVLQMKPVTPETQLVPALTSPTVKPAANVKPAAIPAEFVGEVCHTYSIDDFYVQGRDMAELEALQERLNTYCNQTPPAVFNPAQGQICCARFSGDGLWYRGRVMQPDVGGKCHVFFMDFGNREAVLKTDLRRCTPDLSHLPPQAFRCALHDLAAPPGGWRECDTALFVEALVGGPCHFTRRDTVSDLHHVTVLHPIHGDLTTLLHAKRVGVATPQDIAVVRDSLKTILENETLKQQIAAMTAMRANTP